MRTSTRRILIRVDGSPSIGMGHVVRCLALAASLRRRGIAPLFITRSSDDNILRLLHRKQAPVEIIGPNVTVEEECLFIRELGRKSNSRVLLLDVNNGTTFPDVEAYHAYLRTLRGLSLYLATLEDFKDYPFPADLVIIPYVGAEKLKLKRASTTEYLLGTKYYVFGDGFEGVRHRPKKKATNILITMGGSDPVHLTEKAVRAMAKTGFHLDVLLGPCATDRESQIRLLLKEFRGTYRIILGTNCISQLFEQADLALVGSGLTKYETSVMGLPAVALSSNSQHAEVMRTFARRGSVLHLGDASRVSEKRIADTVSGLMRDHVARMRMSRVGKKLLDTKGADRIVSVLLTKAMQNDSH